MMNIFLFRNCSTFLRKKNMEWEKTGASFQVREDGTGESYQNSLPPSTTGMTTTPQHGKCTFNLTPNGARLNNQLANPTDPEDEAMNDNLYLLANGFSSFIGSNRDLLGIVYSNGENNSDQDIKYSILVGLDPRFKTLMNAYLMPICPVDPKEPGHDCLQHLDNDMIYKGATSLYSYANSWGISVFFSFPLKWIDLEVRAEPVIAYKGNKPPHSLFNYAGGYVNGDKFSIQLIYRFGKKDGPEVDKTADKFSALNFIIGIK